ncbi:DUF2937 family protein [Thalassotalea piscium]
MLKFLVQLIDNVLFTLMFLLGIQLPAFINAYRQHLSGHLNEAKTFLNQYQSIADLQYQGNIEQLVAAFQNNSDIAIKQISSVITNNIESVHTYQQQLFQLEDANYLRRIYYFITELDFDKAVETLRNFVPAIPLEINALITGFILSLLLSTLLKISYLGGKKIIKRQSWLLSKAIKKAQE